MILVSGTLFQDGGFMKLRKGIFIVTSAMILAGGLGAQSASANPAMKINPQWWSKYCGHNLSAAELAEIRSSLRDDSWHGSLYRIAQYPDKYLREAMRRGCKVYYETGRVERAVQALWG